MVETFTLEQIQEYMRTLPGLSDEVRNSVVSSLSSLGSYSQHWSEVAGKVRDFREEVSRSTSAVGAFKGFLETNTLEKYFTDASDGVSNFLKSMEESTDDVKLFGMQLALLGEPLVGLLPKSADVFGRISADGARAGNDLSDSFSKLSPALSKVMPASVSKYFDELLKTTDKAKQLESALLRVSAASGDLNSMLENSGDNLADISSQTSSFARVTYDVAQATGQSVSSVSEYALQLAQIPGALRDNVDVMGSAVSTMNLMEASLKVGTAYGLDNKTTIDLLTNAYRELGTTGTDAVSIIARIGSAAQDLKMPFDILQTYTKSVANQFKLMGDNSQAAINVLDRMSTALKDSGLGPQAIADITKGMIDGVKGMNEATKAFISGATGGPGGLAGTFEIDFLIKEGKLDEVSQMVTQAMQKQFGKVVTLDDVNRNPGQSGELLKQVEYLKQVAGIAKTNEEAYRILEAMQKGEQVDVGQTTKGPEDALRESIDLGSTIQKSQLTVLNVMANKMEQLVQIQAIQNFELLKTYTGTKGDGDISRMLGSLTDEKTKVASTEGAVGVSGKQRIEKDDYALESLKGMGDMYGAVKSGMGAFIDYSKDLIKKTKTPETEGQGVGAPGKDMAIAPTSAAGAVARGIRPDTGPISPVQALQPYSERSRTSTVTEGKDVPRDQLLDGNLHITVDLKDGITTIAKTVFSEEWSKIVNSTQTGVKK